MPEVVTSCWMPSFSVQVAVKRGSREKWVIEWRKWTVVQVEHKVQGMKIIKCTQYSPSFINKIPHTFCSISLKKTPAGVPGCKFERLQWVFYNKVQRWRAGKIYGRRCNSFERFLNSFQMVGNTNRKN